MNIINNIYIQKYHQHRIDEFGSDNAKSLGWFTTESQYKRFDILTKIGDLNNTSILDVGCGNGDLCEYLMKKYTGIRYYGIDFIESFLENAIKRNQVYENASFYLGDFLAVKLPATDYTLLSGSLNYKNTDPEFIYKAITKLYQNCKIGFGFNLLSETQNLNGILTAYPPELIKDFCETLSPNVIISNDYEENDFTVMMYK